MMADGRKRPWKHLFLQLKMLLFAPFLNKIISFPEQTTIPVDVSINTYDKNITKIKQRLSRTSELSDFDLTGCSIFISVAVFLYSSLNNLYIDSAGFLDRNISAFSFVSASLYPLTHCTRLVRFSSDFAVFHPEVQGDLGAAAAFCTSKTPHLHLLLPPWFPRLSYFIACSSLFQMSNSRQTCNGGQPQRRGRRPRGPTRWQM